MIRPDDYHLAAFAANHDPHPEWRAEANCAGVDPNLFFPGPGDHARYAITVCAGCAVRAQCLTLGRHHGTPTADDETGGSVSIAAELRSLAYDVGKMGDFIRRPDLNAENIRLLDWQAAKLHEAADLIERLDAERQRFIDCINTKTIEFAAETRRTLDANDRVRTLTERCTRARVVAVINFITGSLFGAVVLGWVLHGWHHQR